MSEHLNSTDTHWERELAFGSLFVGSLLVSVSLAALSFGI